MILWQRLQSAVRQQRYIRMIHVHVAVERNTNSVAEDAKENQVKITGSASEDEAFLFRFYGQALKVRHCRRALYTI